MAEVTNFWPNNDILNMRLTIFVLSVMAFTACRELIGERGNDERVSRDITVDSFDRIDIGGAFDVILKSSDSHEVKLEVDENLIRYIDISVRGNTLHIGTDRRLSSRQGIYIEVPIQNLSKISSSGASNIETKGQLQLKDLDVDLSGAGKLDLELDAESVSIELSGAAMVYLEGAASELEVEMSGAGSLEADGMEVVDCTISISGVGSALVNVSGRLDAQVSGLGKVEYIGSPKSVKGDVSGVGNVRKVRN